MSNAASRQEQPKYQFVEAEQTEIDRDNEYLYLLARNPEYAARWLSHLNAAIAELPDFPGPLANAIDEDASRRYRREIRRLLLHGPKKRRGGMAWHVFYTVFPPDGQGVSVIRILRIRSALRGSDEPRIGE